jgi:hypothetical protein
MFREFFPRLTLFYACFVVLTCGRLMNEEKAVVLTQVGSVFFTLAKGASNKQRENVIGW